jgi:hypothetical protein
VAAARPRGPCHLPGRPFSKVLSEVTLSSKCTRALTFENFCQEGFTIPDVGRQEDMLTFESNVVFVMRYMVDAKIVGANWVTLPAGTYFLFFI